MQAREVSDANVPPEDIELPELPSAQSKASECSHSKIKIKHFSRQSSHGQQSKVAVKRFLVISSLPDLGWVLPPHGHMTARSGTSRSVWLCWQRTEAITLHPSTA